MILLGIIGGTEIIVILLIVLVLFGGKKIPELMRGLGKGVKEYKNAVNSVEEEINDTNASRIRSSSEALEARREDKVRSSHDDLHSSSGASRGDSSVDVRSED